MEQSHIRAHKYAIQVELNAIELEMIRITRCISTKHIKREFKERPSGGGTKETEN